MLGIAVGGTAATSLHKSAALPGAMHPQVHVSAGGVREELLVRGAKHAAYNDDDEHAEVPAVHGRRIADAANPATWELVTAAERLPRT